ncbi:rubrivinodin family lasso peptide [Roseateles cellulosilyticus]|uniref:Benenodin family lasso peptide n=1 Tax=Pelomonas cellulosilytica TaxID=2906762 RepID=A0ABS8XZI8_9BURK|nr:rubrivinodin family lasso peptide [Pelomonas sp. P8]MCE4558024.1 benenodin family lasso peptide [Pelomonas sp. P8]
MNEAPQLEIVDLGDAKEETKGRPTGIETETNDVSQYKA